MSTYNFELCAEGLLAQNVLAGLDSLDRLLGVCCGDGCNNDCLQTLVLEHQVEVAVDLDAPWLKVLFCPGSFLGIRCEGRDQLGLGCAVEEMEGMASAHAAEAGASNLESAEFNHCENLGEE